MGSASAALNGSGNQQVWVYTALSSQDINGNFSQYYGEVRYYGNGWGSYTSNTQYWGATFAGQNVGGSFTIPYANRNDSYTVLWAGYYNVGHNADGTMGGFGVSASIDSDHTSIGDGTASFTEGAAPTIPRASTPSFVGGSSLTTGAAVTINTNWASSGFTHTASWSFGSLSGQTTGFSASSGIGASFTWTPPASMLTQIPNAAVGSGTLYLNTYSGATLIGSKSVGFTITAAGSIVPTISSVTIADQNSTVVSQVGAYVQGLSILRGTVNAAGVQGSTIASSSWSMNGMTAASGGDLTPTGSGTVAVGGAATDTRGRVGTYTSNITVMPYAAPKINSAQVRRALSSGVVDDNGTYLRIDLNALVQSLIVGSEKNTLTIKVFTRLYGTTPWTARNVILHSATSYNTNVLITGGAIFPVNQSFDVKIEVTDKFNTANPAMSQTVVSTAAIFMHWSQTGVGIGKYHTQGVLDVAGQIYQNNNPVLDSTNVGTYANQWEGVVSSTWTYGKPNVTLTVGGSVVSAFLPSRDVDVQPGSTVILNRTPGDIWTIVAVKNSAPQFLRQIPLVPASGWFNYDADPASPFFSNATEAGINGAGRHSPAGVTQSSTGWVVGRGLFYAPAAMPANSTITTIPAALAPLTAKRFSSTSGPTGGYMVYATGRVATVNAAAAGMIISLANMLYNISAVTRTTLSGYANSWVDSGDPSFGVARHGVDSLGWAFTEGHVKNGSVTNNATIATSATAGALTPGATLTRHQPSASANAFLGAFYIASAGLQYNTTSGGNSQLSLDGGFWDPESLAVPWIAASMKNSWTAYGSPFPAAAFYKRSDGLVCIRGFIQGGAIGSAAFTLPEGYRPGMRTLWMTLTSPNTNARIDINRNGDFVILQAVSTWVSIEGIVFAPEY